MPDNSPTAADLSALQDRFARAADDDPSLCALVAYLPGGPREDDPDPGELERRMFAGGRCRRYEDYKEVMECLAEPVWRVHSGADAITDRWDCRLYISRGRTSGREPDRFLSLAESAARLFTLGQWPSSWLTHLAGRDLPGAERMDWPKHPGRWHAWIQNVSSASAWFIGTQIALAEHAAGKSPKAADRIDASRIEALLGEDSEKIHALAVRTDMTVEQKLPAIYQLDNRSLGWTAVRWSTVLGVTDAAVRKTDWWKFERPRLRG